MDNFTDRERSVWDRALLSGFDGYENMLIEIGFYEAIRAGHVGGVPISFYLAGALCGEAGELMNLVKKNFRDGSGVGEPGKRYDEMGDVLAYLTALCVASGVSLSYIAERNLAKLKKRKAEREEAKGNG